MFLSETSSSPVSVSMSKRTSSEVLGEEQGAKKQNVEETPSEAELTEEEVQPEEQEPESDSETESEDWRHPEGRTRDE